VITRIAGLRTDRTTVADMDERPVAAELRGLDERRRLLLSLGMLCYPFLAATGISRHTSGAGLVAGYLLLTGISGCYLAVVVASMRSAWRAYTWLLAVMVVLAVLVAPLAREDVMVLAAVVRVNAWTSRAVNTTATA
jgi:two-component system sensor histidine kinase DesK